MRGEDNHAERLFSYVRLETRIPTDHPLRAIWELVDAALKDFSRSFDRLYAREGRPSIPPERLLRALLLQAFYTVRSERQLMEQLDYNLLFRWLLDCLRTIRCGMRRYFARTAIGCSTAISRQSFSQAFSTCRR
jgi:transposase